MNWHLLRPALAGSGTANLMTKPAYLIAKDVSYEQLGSSQRPIGSRVFWEPEAPQV